MEVARLLLQAGAEPDALARLYGGGCTTLSLLVSSTHPAQAGVQVPLVHALLDAGADVEGAEATALERHQVLALAVINGRHAVVPLRMESSEDPNRLNPSGMHAHQTPLHGAALRGDLEMVRLLVAHGARADVADAVQGGTALDWARHGGRDEVVEFLEGVGKSGE